MQSLWWECGHWYNVMYGYLPQHHILPYGCYFAIPLKDLTLVVLWQYHLVLWSASNMKRHWINLNSIKMSQDELKVDLNKANMSWIELSFKRNLTEKCGLEAFATPRTQIANVKCKYWISKFMLVRYVDRNRVLSVLFTDHDNTYGTTNLFDSYFHVCSIVILFKRLVFWSCHVYKNCLASKVYFWSTMDHGLRENPGGRVKSPFICYINSTQST